jgi:Kef-type K+ transport system membrane component KefB
MTPPMTDPRAWLLSLGLAGWPAVAWAGAGEPGGVGPVLFGVAVLVTSAKIGGLVAERWGQPPVLGELLIGIALGNLLPVVLGGAGVGFVRADPTLRFLAEVGVLVLLFDVGLEADLRALVRVGPSALLVAAVGVVAPIGFGWGLAAWLQPEAPMLAHVFVGATLAATSVGITARVLRDLGATRTREAQTILGAAIVDDVLGLVVLAVIAGAVSAAGSGPALTGGAIALIVVRAAVFLGASAAIGHFFSGPIVRLIGRLGHPEMLLVVGLSLCFTLAFVAEAIGLAAIVGAFAAGLLLDPYGRGVRTHEETATLAELVHPIAALFVPLFFVLMGIQVDLLALTTAPSMGLGAILVAAAIAGKLACALGVLDRGVDRLAVAVGMIPRGEVGLIFAGIGTSLTLDGRPLLSPALFSAVIVMVLVTTLLAPPLLRWRLGSRRPG